MSHLSQELIEAVRRFEGLHLKAYRCPSGHLTIGYGHTQGVKSGQAITAAQAEAILIADLNEAHSRVLAIVPIPLTQSQAEALTDFIFNLGEASLRKSTLLQKIIRKAPTPQIQAEFRRWIYASTSQGRIILKGLVARREWEASMWARQP